MAPCPILLFRRVRFLAGISCLMVLWLSAAAMGAPFPNATSGVYALLMEKPFTAEVTSMSVSETGGYHLSLRGDNGGARTFQSVSSQPVPEQKLVETLKPGRRYAFPQHFIDQLGLDNTVAVIRMLPQRRSGAAGSFAPLQTGLLDLGRGYPLRAVVLDQGLGETSYSIVLQGADSQLYHIQGDYGEERFKRAAEQLKRGGVYEFPAAVDDILLTAEEREAKARPKTAEAAVLERYIGAWRGRIEGKESVQVSMNCHWKADGSGIWREIASDPKGGEEPRKLEIALVTVDASRQFYLSGDPAAGSTGMLASTWDAATRTFTTKLPMREGGGSRVNSATFTTEDRIEWKTVTKDGRGQTVNTSRGSYDRISKNVPAVKLPPQRATSTLTATFAKDGRMLSMQTITSGAPPPVTYGDFFKLRKAPPFRGRITHLKVDDQSIMATIERGDLQQVSIRHTPGEDWGKALRIAERLKQDGVYEFPAVLADEYQAPPEGFVPQASTEAMRSLSGFIGEWQMRFITGPGKDMKEAITVRYFWNNDGTGLWREVRVPTSMTGRPRVNVTLTTYDPEAKGYREISSTPPTKEMKESAEWDAATQTLTLHTTEGVAPHTSHHGTRRIVSPDRIEFHTTARKPDGSLLHETEGYYERIKP